MSPKLRWTVRVAVLSALAIVLYMVDFPITFLFPEYLKYDFSDVIALVASFAMGPLAGVAIELIKNLVTLGAKSWVVVSANFVAGATFVAVAGAVYMGNKTRTRAIVGMLAGAVAATLVMIPANALVFMPLYGIKQGTWAAALYGVTPFNLFKGAATSVVTFAVYKRVRVVLEERAQVRISQVPSQGVGEAFPGTKSPHGRYND